MKRPSRSKIHPVLVGLLGWLIFLSPVPAGAGQVHVAVAANFTSAFKEISRSYEKSSEHRVLASLGATGLLAAQARNGAPYDLFLSADKSFALLLETTGTGLPGSRFTYAVGRLALWSTVPNLAKQLPVQARQVLREGAFDHLAIANPKTAPYGAAARAVLEGMELWIALKPHRVIGQNISQTYQFVASGNAELGFVALAQLLAGAHSLEGYWLVPENLHQPLEQQALLLRPAKDNPAALGMHRYLQGAKAREIILAHGYGLK